MERGFYLARSVGWASIYSGIGVNKKRSIQLTRGRASNKATHRRKWTAKHHAVWSGCVQKPGREPPFEDAACDAMPNALLLALQHTSYAVKTASSVTQAECYTGNVTLGAQLKRSIVGTWTCADQVCCPHQCSLLGMTVENYPSWLVAKAQA